MLVLWTIEAFGKQHEITNEDMFLVVGSLNLLMGCFILLVGISNLKTSTRLLKKVVEGTESTNPITYRLVGVLSAFTNRFSFKRNRR